MSPIEPLPHIFPCRPAYIFSDVDDTLTLDRRLPREAFNALHDLNEAGIPVVPVTGASAGWCDCILRTWPVDTVIGENGAFIMSREEEQVSCRFMQDEETRLHNLGKLRALAAAIDKEIPEARLTGDCNYRITDIAYDIGQDRTLSPGSIQDVLAICRVHHVHARASSIHINIWLGDYSKSTTASSLLKHRGVSENQTVFIGDSPNDEAMFTTWTTTVGVANIAPFLSALPHAPMYVTRYPGGLGFAELAAAVLRTDTPYHGLLTR